MKKIVIPAILAATVLVAGMFSFLPVEKAQTVHTTIQANSDKIITLTAVVTPEGTGADQTATWTVGAPFRVLNILATNTVDAGNDNNLAASVVTTNLIISA